MEKIKSFTVDHLVLQKGLYLSRADGGIITADLRMCAPYKDALLSNAALHSLEHILATVLRNGRLKENVVYVGPMGCQTGFYCLFRDAAEKEIVSEIVAAFKYIAQTDFDMPGSSEAECGNCRNLSVLEAKDAAKNYYAVIKNKTVFDEYR